ncbi:MAG: DUF4363 family protein [Clostridia bacterium]|nr:DUF4363 family protein [Clostridia bacterium]
MVKSIISMIAVALILTFGVVFETTFIKDEFKGLKEETAILYDKIEAETANDNDVYVLQTKWVNAKEKLHAFISHNEIKEFDLWIAETVKYVAEKNWNEALTKMEVIMELIEQVPKTFEFSFANVF